MGGRGFAPRFWDNSRADRLRLLAYWQILHAHERRGLASRSVRPADLRLMSTRSATLSDILEAWMLTRPQKQTSPTARSRLARGAATPEAAAWWSS